MDDMTDTQIIEWIAGTIIEDYERQYNRKLTLEEKKVIINQVILDIADMPDPPVSDPMIEFFSTQSSATERRRK